MRRSIRGTSIRSAVIIQFRTSQRQGQFRPLWWSQAVSSIGDEITLIGLPTLVLLQLHGSPSLAALLVTVQVIPGLIVSAVCGRWLDRADQRRIMIGADVGRGLVLFGVVLTAHFAASPGWIMVPAAMLGALSALFDLAYQAYLPQVVAQGELTSANASVAGIRNVSRLAGPLVGGLLVAAIGPANALAADGVTFLASALILLAFRPRVLAGAPQPPPRETHGPALPARERGSGLRLVLGTPSLRKMAAGTAAINLGGAIIAGAYFAFVYQHLRLSPSVVGVFAMLGNLGAVIGAWLTVRLLRRFGYPLVMSFTATAIALGGWLIPLAQLGWAIVLLAVYEFSFRANATVLGVSQATLRQLVTAPDLQARCYAVFRNIVQGSLPLGAAITAAILTVTDVGLPLVLGAALTSTSVLWLVRGARSFTPPDSPPSHVESADTNSSPKGTS